MTVLAREQARVTTVLGSHAGAVRVVLGDVRRQPDVSAACEGADALVSAVGPVKGSPPDLMALAAAASLHAVRAMPRRRLVWLTGAGVRRPGDTPGVVDRLIVGVMSVATPSVLRDSRAGVAAVTAATDVDWTVVRAPRLTDDAGVGAWRTAERVGGGHGTRLPRADLATVLLDLAESGDRVHGSPVVSS